jgi:hypothetical protein
LAVPPPCGLTLSGGSTGRATSHNPSGTIHPQRPLPMTGHQPTHHVRHAVTTVNTMRWIGSGGRVWRASWASRGSWGALANHDGVTQLLPLLDAVPPVRGRRGPRRRPDSLLADRGYEDDVCRDQVRARGIVPAVARRGTRHGTCRWVGERTFALLHGFRRLRVRWERLTSTKPSSNSPAA